METTNEAMEVSLDLDDQNGALIRSVDGAALLRLGTPERVMLTHRPQPTPVERCWSHDSSRMAKQSGPPTPASGGWRKFCRTKRSSPSSVTAPPFPRKFPSRFSCCLTSALAEKRQTPSGGKTDLWSVALPHPGALESVSTRRVRAEFTHFKAFPAATVANGW